MTTTVTTPETPPTAAEIVDEIADYLETLVEDVRGLTPGLGSFANIYVYSLAFGLATERLRLSMGEEWTNKLFQRALTANPNKSLLA
jgi:hypothetical protein